jgi:hypothetical protein
VDPAVRRNIYDGGKADRLVSAEDAAASARKYKTLDGEVKLDGNQNGRFPMRESDIEGLSRAEIEKKFSLPDTPE